LLGTAAPAHATVTVSLTNDVALAEGNAGTTPFHFNLHAVNNDAMAPSVAGSVLVTTADGTAIAGGVQPAADYTGRSFTQVIPIIAAAGTFDVDVQVDVNGDVTFEPNETFTVNLSAPVNVLLGTAARTGTITNDDNRPALVFVNPAAQAENVTPLNFVVALENPTYLDVSFNVSTIVGSATSAPSAAGTPDYTEILNQTFTILAGTLSVNVPVTLIDDLIHENTENFELRFTNFTNQFVAIDPVPGGVAAEIGTINDNDAFPTFTISAPATVLCESDNPIQVTVTLSQPSGTPATVTLVTTGSSAIAGTDFTLAPTTLNFAPGQTVATATLTPLNDNLVEGPETIVITAQATTGVTGPNQVLPTITLNDPDSLDLNLIQISGGSVISINGVSQQCFRVTVTDGCGDPFANQTVTFTVSGTTGNNQSVDVVLDNAGVGEYCFTPVFPGSDSIQVSTSNGIQTFFSNTINLDFTVGSNTGNASVTGAGATDAAEAAGPVGIFSFFSLDVKNLRNGRTQGSVNGVLPLAGAASLRSLKMTNLIAGQGLPDGKKALAFGTAKLIIQIGGPGSGIRTVQAPVLIRVDALDNGLPGVPNDRFEVTFLVDLRVAAGRNAVAGGKLPSGTFTVGGNVEHGNNGARGDIRITTGLGGSF